jgi:hypothetical protein
MWELGHTWAAGRWKQRQGRRVVERTKRTGLRRPIEAAGRSRELMEMVLGAVVVPVDGVEIRPQ